MNNTSGNKGGTVIIEPVYPHPMLIHISRLADGENQEKSRSQAAKAGGRQEERQRCNL